MKQFTPGSGAVDQRLGLRLAGAVIAPGRAGPPVSLKTGIMDPLARRQPRLRPSPAAAASAAPGRRGRRFR